MPPLCQLLNVAASSDLWLHKDCMYVSLKPTFCPFFVFGESLDFREIISFVNCSSLDLFDHPGTVFYAVFMSFWGKFFCPSSSLFSSIGIFHLLQKFTGPSYLDISKEGIILLRSRRLLNFEKIYFSHFTECSFEKFWMLISFVVKLRLSFEISLALVKFQIFRNMRLVKKSLIRIQLFEQFWCDLP